MTKHRLNPTLIALLVYTFFMVLGFTMLMPLVSVHYVSNLGMAATLVGTALAVRQFTQQGLSVVSGFLADKVGMRPLILLGLLVRALGFIYLAVAHEPWQLFAGLILAAVGGALFETPYQAAIIHLTSEKDRSQFYLVSNWVVGVATTLGPLLGATLIGFGFETVCLIAGLCFLVNLLVAIFQVPRDIGKPSKTAEQKERLVLSNEKPFLLFLVFMTGYWFVSMQINISFPLFIELLTNDIRSVGIMFAISSILTIALQYSLVKWLQKRLNDSDILILGIFVMSLSCLAIGLLEQSYSVFLLLVATFSIGAILTRPTQQSLTALFTQNKATASLMGISALSLAIGGGLGNVAGGWLFDITYIDKAGSVVPSWTPWVSFFVIGLVSALGMIRLFRDKQSAKFRTKRVN